MNEQLIQEVRQLAAEPVKRNKRGHTCNWRCYPGYCVDAPKRETRVQKKSQR